MTQAHNPDETNSDMSALAKRMGRLESSLVRDMLRLTEQPGIISFCGGLPAASMLPAVERDVLPAREAGQYGTTEGEPALRTWVAEHLTGLGRPCRPEQVLITNGAQQGLDLCAKLLVDEGSGVICEAPTYLAALQVFRLFGADLRPVPVSAEGLETATLRQALSPPAARCAYLVPTFQNPGAHCYPEANRRAVAEALDERGTVLLEDGAYAELAFEPMAAAPISGYLRRAPWVYLGSFSKVLMPGLRLGYIAADERLVPYLARLKQAADLHSSRFGQHWLLRWLERHDYTAQVASACATYRHRRDVMAEALSRHLGDAAQWSLPGGGLFFWVRISAAGDTMHLFRQALNAGVAFMPGAAFFPTQAPPTDWMRLNFSNPAPEDIHTGISRLARLIDTTTGGYHAPAVLPD